MKVIYAGLLALALAGCSEMTTADLVEKVKPGTVLITNQIDATSGGIGTGFILDDNTIITNNHVIDGKNNKIQVISPTTSKKYDATVVYTDAIADIAIVQLKDWDAFKKEQKPADLDLGDSDKMVEGSKVVIIGHPWGLNWTVSQGIVSAKSRRAGPNPKYVDQLDAKLFQGNSGGPVFNEKGEVICVSELMLTGEGGSYGFCIPSNLVEKVVHDFKTLGQVRWRALNVSIGLTDDGSSVILEQVQSNGAAEKAGMKAGDKVLSIFTSKTASGGKKVTKPDDLITALAELDGNDEDVRIAIERDGKELVLNVKTSYKLSKDYEPDKSK